MECLLLTIGVVTAVVVLSVWMMRWEVLRGIDRFHAVAVTTLIKEEAAMDVLDKEIVALDTAIEWVWNRNRRILGKSIARGTIPTEPDFAPLRAPGISGDRDRGAGPDTASES